MECLAIALHGGLCLNPCFSEPPTKHGLYDFFPRVTIEAGAITFLKPNPPFKPPIKQAINLIHGALRPVLAKKASEDQKPRVAGLRARSCKKKQVKTKSLMWQGSTPVLAKKQGKTKSLMWQGSAPVLAKKASEDQKPRVAGLRARSCAKKQAKTKSLMWQVSVQAKTKKPNMANTILNQANK
ncbi:uncharacterized protein G2W53_039655 [Senna tora]|uniref:Uncharacterized protein n=1 Tax=Senna tora TaxID=362788 RepID=A0A834T1L7_9FABA|nr:uncharacterized protein G2W53_039655 [Senna tora]